jgi:hypothetical protein
MTNKVYIVEEFYHDHHANVGVFSSEEKARAHCEAAFGQDHVHGYWVHGNYTYTIEEYLIEE